MANEADEIVAEYKKMNRHGTLGDNDLSITDRLLESIFGTRKKLEKERKEREEDAAKEAEWRKGL